MNVITRSAIRIGRLPTALLLGLLAFVALVSASPALAQSAPGTPASVSVSRSGDTLTATWDAPAGATKYHVTYSSDNKNSWSAAAGPGDGHSAASITISGIDTSKSYVVAVRAGNAHGWSGWRNSAANAPETPPSTPGAITITRADGSLTASWNAVAGADKYHITYSSDNRKSWSLASFDHASSSISFAVSNGHTYIVGVRAGKTSGNVTLWSGWRNSSASGPWGPPAAPAQVTTSRDCWEFSFSWTPVTGATGYDLVSSYTNRKSWQRMATNTTSTSGVFTHWQKDKTYYLGVRARNANGESGWTNSAAAHPPTCEVGEPGNPKATTSTTHGTDGGAITTTWDAGQDASAYNLNYQVGADWTRIASNVSATTHTGTVSSTATTAFAVQSIGNNVTSEWRQANIGWLTASGLSATGVTLTIAGHSDAWYVKQTSSPPGTCSDAISGTTHALTTLTAGATYTHTAYNDAECAQVIGSATFTTPELRVGSITSSGATLTLTGHSGSWYYQADTAPDMSCSASAVTGATKTLSSLTAGSTYTYSAYSDSACTTLLATATAFTTPTFALTASNISGTGATLNLPTTEAWSYKETKPSVGTCANVDANTTTATLSSLTANTFYEYTAYSGNGCAGSALDTTHFSTTDYSVGNLGEAASATSCAVGHKSSAANQCAIAFTTGPVSGGYRLHSVSARFGAKTGSPGNISVAVHAANSGNPASTALATLSGSNPDAAGIQTYSCSGEGCDLTANTTYFVVMSTGDTSGSKYYALDTTVFDAQTGHPASNGWSIANAGRSKAGSAAWAALGTLNLGRSPMLHVAAVTRPPMPATAVETNTVTLSLPNQTAQWYYKASAAAAAQGASGQQAGGASVDTCKGPVAAAGTATVTGLTGGSSYTISAYSDSACTSANYIASTLAFTTLEEVTVSNLNPAVGDDESVSYLRAAVPTQAQSAQAFTTGSAAGYTLTSVTIDFYNVNGTYPVTVTLREADDSNSLNPSSAVKATLVGDSPTDRNVNYTYTCSGASCELKPDTTYFIHLESTNPHWWNNATVWQGKTSSNQTLSPSDNGWSIIAAARNSESGSAWGQYSTNSNPRPAALKVVAATKPKLTAGKVLAASATLTLSSEFGTAYSGSWWLKRTSPSATSCQSKGTTATERVSGLTSNASYTYKAYSDSACATANEIATLSFTTTDLTASEISGSGATLKVVRYTGTWYYKATTGPHTSCSSAVLASTIATIDGLNPATSYTYTAYSNSACTTASKIGSATFSTLSLAVAGITATSATLEYSGGGSWYYKADKSPHTSCSATVSGTTETLTGLTRGETYTYTIHSDAACTTTAAATATFTTAELSVGNLTETASANQPARLDWSGSARTNLANSFTTGDHSTGYTLTALTVDFGATTGSPGALSVEVWSDGSGRPGALQTTLSGANPSSAGQYSYGCAQDCDVSPGTSYWLVMYTASGSATALYDTTWTASDGQTNAPSDAGWSIGDAASSATGASPSTWSAVSPAESVRFSVSANARPALVVSNVRGTTASLTLTNYDGSWHYKADTGPDATCSTSAVTSGSTESLSGLTVGTSYTYKAYSDSACANQIVAAPAFTAIQLTISKLSNSSGELTIAGHTGGWYYQADTGPDNTCSTNAVTGTTEAISGLTKDTDYTYRAYGDSTCTAELSVLTFKTLPSSLSASTAPTTATLTIGDHTSNWYVKRTSPSGGSCSSAAGSNATQNLTGLSSVTAYVYHAYSDSSCSTKIARVAFITNPHPPQNVRAYSHNVTWNRSDHAPAGVGIGYVSEYQCALYVINWTHLKTFPELTSTYYTPTIGCITILIGRVKAYKVVDGTRVESVWVQSQ